MKALKLFTVLFFIILASSSCTDDNYDLYDESADEHTPTVIEVENAITFRVGGGASTYTDGVAYRNNTTYHVGSEDVIIECVGDNGLSYSFFGGDYFSFLFFKNGDTNFVPNAGFTTTIDGKELTVQSEIIPGICSAEPIQLEVTEESDRLKGNISGEFYVLADSIVSPFDSCVNFISVGILEASFDVELIVCE